MTEKRPYSPQPALATSIAEAPTQIWLPRPAKVARRRKWRVILAVACLLLFIGGLALAGGGAALLYYSDWILPGVAVLGVDMGGQTTKAAEAALEAQWRRQVIMLEAEESVWMVAPEALGVSLDTAVTASQVRQIGRSPDSLQQWLQAGGQAEIAPAWQIDLSIAEANLQKLAAEFEIPPQNAGIELVDGRFIATEPKYGRSLDIPSAITWLEQSAAQAVLHGRLQLPTIAIAPEVADMSGAVAEANRLLGTAVALRAYDPITDETVNWIIAPEQWSQWLLWSSDGTQFDWSLDESQARAFLENWELGAGRFVDVDGAATAVAQAIAGQNPNINLRIYHHPRQHTVQSGETLAAIGRAYGIPYPWIQAANPGVNSLHAGQTLTIPSPDAMLPLPVVENKRLIVSISQQRLWAYEDGALKWEWLASTGIDDSPTSPGVFQIQTHEANAYAGNWNLWMPYFMGIYQPVPTSSFMNGFHGFPTRDGQNILWTSSLGRQVTYGCILVSTTNAAQLFEWAEVGIAVEIRP
ncbi:MAG: L,D-transpeptidase family protein [Chloroflexi bacterium]|nr:L,D-transpeptidase family protein [Chloroflexota bacterium]